MTRFQGLAVVAAAAAVLASPARAGEKLLTGPPPAWVKPVTLPAAPAGAAGDAAVAVLLQDQQADLQPGRQSRYSENVLRIQTAQGLAAGSIAFSWNPDTDTATVHRLVIRRGAQVIDVLGSGQRFTVVRRESNLENAVIDGVLTATIQPEGLQVGDIVDFAATISRSDPGLKTHIEEIGGGWNMLPVAQAHMRVQWPAAVPMRLRTLPGLPELKPVRRDGMASVELLLKDVEPIRPPNGAPARFALSRIWELSDFGSWSDLAALMAPLYAKAAQVGDGSALQAEVSRIAAASADPKARTEAALALVQQRIRYVFLGMNDGGIVPADAETTWSRRFGDCKAKTALLLAVLKGLGIDAQAVLVNAVGGGDGLDARLPALGLFNHVLVRATVGARSYWLDGTRDGDRDLALIKVPFFRWGLPLVPGAALVPMVPPPLGEPLSVTRVRIDASAGLTAPAPFHVETLLRDDLGYQTGLTLANQAAGTRDSGLRDYWRKQYNFVDVKTVSASYDPARREERLVMDGTAHMDWSSGWYESDGLGLGYQADFSRDPDTDRNAPFAVGYPVYDRSEEVIVLPKGAAPTLSHGEDVDETVAGVAYHRRTVIRDGQFVGEATTRAMVPEFVAGDAPAAQQRLRALANKTVYLRKPDGYAALPAEADAAMLQTPTDAAGFRNRANMLLDMSRPEEAIRDFTAALKLDPRDAAALAGRGVAYAWHRDEALANADLAAAEAIGGKKEIVFHGRAILATTADHFRDAIDNYDKAIAVWPTDDFAWWQRATLNRALGRDEQALHDADVLLSRRPDRLDLRLLKANLLRDRGDRSLAAVEARAIAAAAPLDDAHQVAAAMILARIGDQAGAMAGFDRAIAIAPSAFAYVNRSRARPWRDFAGRAADLDAAAQAPLAPTGAQGNKLADRNDPQGGMTVRARAELLEDRRDYAGAVALLAPLAAGTPPDMEARLALAIDRARLGDRPGAERDLAGLDGIRTNVAVALKMCRQMAAANVLLDRALAACQAAAARRADDPGIMEAQAFVLWRLGRGQEALSAYRAALAQRPGWARALLGRSLAEDRLGDAAAGKADREAALKIDPDLAEEFRRVGAL